MAGRALFVQASKYRKRSSRHRLEGTREETLAVHLSPCGALPSPPPTVHPAGAHPQRAPPAGASVSRAARSLDDAGASGPGRFARRRTQILSATSCGWWVELDNPPRPPPADAPRARAPRAASVRAALSRCLPAHDHTERPRSPPRPPRADGSALCPPPRLSSCPLLPPVTPSSVLVCLVVVGARVGGSSAHPTPGPPARRGRRPPRAGGGGRRDGQADHHPVCVCARRGGGGCRRRGGGASRHGLGGGGRRGRVAAAVRSLSSSFGFARWVFCWWWFCWSPPGGALSGTAFCGWRVWACPYVLLAVEVPRQLWDGLCAGGWLADGRSPFVLRCGGVEFGIPFWRWYR